VTIGIGTGLAGRLRIALRPTERGIDVKKAWVVCPLFMVTLLALLVTAVIRLRRLERRIDAIGASTVELP
jgi:hypothetical protein